MTARRFRSQVNLFAAQSGLCVARFLLALSPHLEFRGRACATGSLMQPERNVLSRKRRRGTLIGNLSKRVKYLGPHPRSNNMEQDIPQEFSTKLIDRSSFVIMRDTMPPRDPDEDEDEEEDDTADEPPVVREPDDD